MNINNLLDISSKEIAEIIYNSNDWVMYKHPIGFFQNFMEWLLWRPTFSSIKIKWDTYKLCEAQTIKILSKYQISKTEIEEIEMILKSRLVKPKEVKKMSLNDKISNYLNIFAIEKLQEKEFYL